MAVSISRANPLIGAARHAFADITAGWFRRKWSHKNFSYAVPVDETAVKMVYKQRSKRLITRVKIADRCLVLAMIGIFFMVTLMPAFGATI